MRKNYWIAVAIMLAVALLISCGFLTAGTGYFLGRTVGSTETTLPATAAPVNPPTATPATPTAAAPPVQGFSSNCPDPYTIDDITGMPHGFWVRVSSEACAFTHRTFPQTFNTICPQGNNIGDYVCTFDVMGDIVVHEGNGQPATVWGATLRYMPVYGNENVCTVWRNEYADGQNRDNPFVVRFQPVPGGVQACQ